MDGRKLEAIRRSHEMSQVELARLADIGQSTVSKIENGEMNNVGVITLGRIAAALGMTAPQLLAELQSEPATVAA